MKIGIIGGGPAGLYFAILMKKADPGHEIDVYERNAFDDTFGWGVVFSDATLGNLEEADDVSYRAITECFATWEEVEVNYKGEVVRSGGHGFCGIERMQLLLLLEARAEELGVRCHYKTEIDSLDRFADCDLIVAADGINSAIRTAHEQDFGTRIDYENAKFIWLGTTRKLEAFTFWLKENQHGFFQIHAYQFNDEKSTFIAECDEESWRAAGLDNPDIDFSVNYLQELFADELEGHPLLTNKSEWITFRTIHNDHWYKDNVVLMGDAVHTAHFSIGSGTKLAMEDSICLARAVCEHDTLPAALADYEEERQWYTEKLQRMAKESLRWFETIKLRKGLSPRQLAYSLMTRNKRLGHDKLWQRDEEWIDGVNDRFAGEADAPPPMFTPFKLRDMELVNRVVVSPMCMYSADDGIVNDFHLVHLGSRAIGGAGLVIAEMTDVSAEARISPGCAGMYKPEHVAAWKRITDFVHANSEAKIALQLGHAGRKGASKLMWDGIDQPLTEGAWPIMAASPIPYMVDSQIPKEMGREDMAKVVANFASAAAMSDEAGFDMLEVHFAHGYLLAGFLSPLTNARTDEYGGSIDNRMRFPLEVFRAVRAVWPQGKPISVRVSAIDWHEDGQKIEDTIAVVNALKESGVDIVDVSSGHTATDEQPDYDRCYQVPFSERIRLATGVPTMTVGAISNHGEINAILASGEADLVVMARPHLYDPYFTRHAAAEQQYHGLGWPKQYGPGAPEPRPKLRWLERERRKDQARRRVQRRIQPS
ncbi:MAG: bifunctional salicylyl-CoA 5-hydroxylase/oxidoreductase [Planctomycetota bacterium]